MLNMIQNADWAILHWIQENLRCGVLDVFLSKLTLRVWPWWQAC